MESEARKLCDMGREFLDRGEPEEALRCYERAIDVDPENPDAWCGRGKAAYDLGRLERADRDFRRALRYAARELGATGGEGSGTKKRRRRWWADPTTRPYLRALHGHGLCRFWLGAYEDAARIFRRLLKLAPTDPLDVRFLVGETYLRMGRIERAVRDLSAVEDDPDALYNLGLAKFYQGDFAGSVNAFRRGFFANLHLPRMLVEAEAAPEHRDDDESDDGGRAKPKKPATDVPTDSGTHPKGLDGEAAANDYVDRCGDFWFGRPILQRWLWSIRENEVVKADVETHVKQLKQLGVEGLATGERARLEGANASLRSVERLAKTDGAIAEAVLEKVFVLRTPNAK